MERLLDIDPIHQASSQAGLHNVLWIFFLFPRVEAPLLPSFVALYNRGAPGKAVRETSQSMLSKFFPAYQYGTGPSQAVCQPRRILKGQLPSSIGLSLADSSVLEVKPGRGRNEPQPWKFKKQNCQSRGRGSYLPFPPPPPSKNPKEWERDRERLPICFDIFSTWSK